MPSRQHRQPFWSHPANRKQHQEHNESVQYPPLIEHHHRRRHQEGNGAIPMMRSAPTTTGSTNNSRIPWSPGQTLASESSLHSPLLVSPAYVHSAGTVAMGSERETASQRHCGVISFLSRWCCRCRCISASAGWCCCRSSHQVDHLQDQYLIDDNNERTERSRRRGGFCFKILYVLVSAFSFGVLYYFSSRGNHVHWTMNPGESRHVVTAGYLTDAVQVVSSPSSQNNYRNRNGNETTSITRGVAVYALGIPRCPLLTGPPVTVDGPAQELVLLHNAFEYQYFYLNKGSTMRVTVHQIQGATNILVLKGLKVLARIQDKRGSNTRGHGAYQYTKLSNDVDFDFSSMRNVVLERFSWTQDHGPIEFSFTSPSNDVYVLLYDNAASSQSATLKVQYHMVLTTYNLEGLVPWCSHTSPVPSSSPSFPYNYDSADQTNTRTSFTCPPLEASTAGCIIVQAVEHHRRKDDGDDQFHPHNSSNPATDDDYEYLDLAGAGVVEVTLCTTRNWLYIGAMSVFPSVLLALWYYCRQRRHRTQWHQYHQHAYFPPPQRHQHRYQHSGPSYHYLPPHQHDGSDQDPSSHDITNGQDVAERQVDRQHQQGAKSSATSGSTNEASETTRCSCVAEARIGQQATSDRNNNESTMISAENVMLVKECQEEEQ